jgi:hypothetical protein
MSTNYAVGTIRMPKDWKPENPLDSPPGEHPSWKPAMTGDAATALALIQDLNRQAIRQLQDESSDDPLRWAILLEANSEDEEGTFKQVDPIKIKRQVLASPETREVWQRLQQHRIDKMLSNIGSDVSLLALQGTDDECNQLREGLLKIAERIHKPNG